MFSIFARLAYAIGAIRTATWYRRRIVSIGFLLRAAGIIPSTRRIEISPGKNNNCIIAREQRVRRVSWNIKVSWNLFPSDLSACNSSPRFRLHNKQPLIRHKMSVAKFIYFTARSWDFAMSVLPLSPPSLIRNYNQLLRSSRGIFSL